MITFQEENWTSFSADARELFKQHHSELALNQDKLPMDMDLEGYQNLEKAGRLFVVTARDDGRLAGYLVAFPVPNHLHYKSSGPMALTDMYYVAPEYRRGIGAKLFLEFEADAPARLRADHDGLQTSPGPHGFT